MIKLLKSTVLGFLIHLTCFSCQSQVEPSRNHLSDPKDIESTTVEGSFEGFRITSPISYKNLQLFPIHGRAALDHVAYMTLGVAMETDNVIVHETGDVNNLSITNKSDQYIYIQSGDIVKGGRQDRTIQYDVLIAPNAKKIDLPSFCVEQSRWSKRGDEVANQFSTSEKMLSNRETKLAAKSKGSQGEVWSSVSKTQDKINGTLKEVVSDTYDIRNNASATSLQLALENEELKKMLEEYKDAFDTNFPTDSVIGFAYAINGVFYGVEMYNNSFLFGEMKNKLIESVITEAISDTKKDTVDFQPLTVQKLVSHLASAKYTFEERTLNAASKWVSGVDNVQKLHQYTLIDLAHESKWLHRNSVNAFDIVEEIPSRPMMRSHDYIQRGE